MERIMVFLKSIMLSRLFVKASLQNNSPAPILSETLTKFMDVSDNYLVCQYRLCNIPRFLFGELAQSQTALSDA